MFNRITRLFAFAFLFLLHIPHSTKALEIPADLRKKLLGEADAKSSGASSMGMEVLDNSLDPQRYLVGGGDRFQISIVGLPSQEYFPTVDPEGNLYDGDLGLIHIGKTPLAQARSIIAEKVKKNLRKNYEVYITLVRIKTSTVAVTGMVANPGTISMPGNLRVLDALKMANNGILPSTDKFNLRRVRVRNGDSLNEYDLLRFLNKQDLDQNPYLYPGDLIALDQVDARVYVTGEVRDFASGWIPVKPGETAGDILSLLNFKETADSGSILVQRSFGGPEGPMKPIVLSEAHSVPVFNNDVISISAKASEGRADTVRITGEVKRPGTYPVSRQGGSLEALIALAGGATEHGSAERVFVLRHHKLDAINLMANPDNNGMGIPVQGSMLSSLQSVRPEVSSSVHDLLNSGDFTLVSASGKSGISVLEDGDEIHIPRKENCIYVSGNVRVPGAYPYEAGKDYDHYIEEAKGYTGKADTKNMYVLASYKGVTQIKDRTDLSPGDIIVVPAAVEYKRWTNVFLPIIMIVPSVLSLIVTLAVLNQ